MRAVTPAGETKIPQKARTGNAIHPVNFNDAKTETAYAVCKNHTQLKPKPTTCKNRFVQSLSKAIGGAIKMQRTVQGMSVEDLAAQTHIGKQTIWAMERGQALHPDKCEIIAQALGTTYLNFVKVAYTALDK